MEQLSNPPPDLLILLGRIDGKLDAALQRQEVHEQNLKEVEARVSRLERNKAYLMGAAAAVGAGASWIKSFIFGT
ncbi:hypothetical protein [Telmatospirillum sp. J64-1]|uniref:hypothetical protein n=1 Tax=Telmatospirillum sp. J64-1 TaxID=2502183 RepID=UPI00115D8DE0|nr:hypothetical protein [Telmatospirillum sp. J64-1]